MNTTGGSPMTRCWFCRGFIWPWQSSGWRMLTNGQARRWHGSCYRAVDVAERVG